MCNIIELNLLLYNWNKLGFSQHFFRFRLSSNKICVLRSNKRLTFLNLKSHPSNTSLISNPHPLNPILVLYSWYHITCVTLCQQTLNCKSRRHKIVNKAWSNSQKKIKRKSYNRCMLKPWLCPCTWNIPIANTCIDLENITYTSICDICKQHVRIYTNGLYFPCIYRMCF